LFEARVIGAVRVPDNEGRCAGNGFAWLRSAHLSDCRAVASSALWDYNADDAKAALDQFVRYVALELAPHGFTANLVAPATVQGSRSTEQFTAERMHELTTATPMGRLVRSDDVAKRRRCLIKS
jgi:NAD(P)-dependent dehydrogenase (short-subunit alcohol dehydrogenase family)